MINSYKRLPIGKYKELLDICSDYNLTTQDRNLEILSVLSGYEVDTLLDMNITDVEIMMQQTAFLDTPLPPSQGYNVAKKYKIQGWVLCPVSDAKKMNVAQYVDFQTFSKEPDKYMVEMLSCLLVPEGKKYNNGYDITELHSIIRDNLSIYDANEVTAFFLHRSLLSIRATLTSSIWTLKRMKPTMKVKRAIVAARQSLTLLRNGDGHSMLMLLPRLYI